MRHNRWLRSLALTLTLLCGLCLVFAHADSGGHELAHFKDPDGILTQQQANEVEQAILDVMSKYAAKKAVPAVYIVLTEDTNPIRFNSDKILAHYGWSSQADIVLLSVAEVGGEWKAHMYTFGSATKNISDKEVEFILHDENVYDNIKHSSDFSSFKAGVTRFTELSVKGFQGRVGVSMFVIILVCLVISLLVGGFACGMVVMKYKMKRQPTNYPLDKYTQMELTDSQDVFVGSYVRKRRIQTSSGGSRGSSGGGSFGSGHRGSI